jgi:hypothetical protein
MKEGYNLKDENLDHRITIKYILKTGLDGLWPRYPVVLNKLNDKEDFSQQNYLYL